MTEITVAVTQMACGHDRRANLERAEQLIRGAAAQGAQIILLQELFETPYFCPEQKAEHFALARPFSDNDTIQRLSALAAELQVVLPVSYFERDNNAHYNSLAMIDACGTVLGQYRKSHIPEGPGYQEKFYFNPGDSGFKVWPTRYGKLGAAVCWDQWFPEAARIMAVAGADLLLYPTAIGCHPMAPGYDSRDTWQRAMQGHAACNAVPVVAANRIGTESWPSHEMTFYGSSFITDHHGAMLATASRDREEIAVAALDFERIKSERAAWGFFRDRRPDLYGPLMTYAGSAPLIKGP